MIKYVTPKLKHASSGKLGHFSSNTISFSKKPTTIIVSITLEILNAMT